MIYIKNRILNIYDLYKLYTDRINNNTVKK